MWIASENCECKNEEGNDMRSEGIWRCGEIGMNASCTLYCYSMDMRGWNYDLVFQCNFYLVKKLKTIDKKTKESHQLMHMGLQSSSVCNGKVNIG